MSQIEDYKPLTLGNTEELFLSIISRSVQAPTVYSIYSALKKTMSYKNVHKRIKRLRLLGLIEPVNGKFERKAIPYRLTSHGLFQCLLSLSPSSPTALILHKYRDDKTLQTILYENLEEETVKELLSIFGEHFFDTYLRRCCEEILTILRGVVFQEHEIDKTIAKHWPNNYKRKIEMSKMRAIEDAIEKQDLNLIFDLIKKSTEDEFRGIFPNQVLIRDQYLVQSVEAIRDYLDDGFKNFIMT